MHPEKLSGPHSSSSLLWQRDENQANSLTADPADPCSGVAKLFGPQAIFRNLDEGVGHTTKFDFFHYLVDMCYAVLKKRRD